MKSRRALIKTAGLLSLGGLLTQFSILADAGPLSQRRTQPAPKGQTSTPAPSPATSDATCLAKQTELTTESADSPFFQHFHQLSIPVVALLKPPAEGITVQTSVLDQHSYDVDKFKEFIQKSGLDSKKLSLHTHAVFISADELSRIAGGESNVEIRVTSANGNYVHNFLVTATGSTLAKVRRYKAGKIQI